VTGAVWGRLRARREVRRHPSDGHRTYGFSPELVAGTASPPCARRPPRCTSCCSPASTAPRFGTMKRCLVVVNSTGRSVPAPADLSRGDRPAADLQPGVPVSRHARAEGIRRAARGSANPELPVRQVRSFAPMRDSRPQAHPAALGLGRAPNAATYPASSNPRSTAARYSTSSAHSPDPPDCPATGSRRARQHCRADIPADMSAAARTASAAVLLLN
jgi:hypothetical protein